MKKDKLFLSLVLIITIATGYFVTDKIIGQPKTEKLPNPVFKYTVDEKRKFFIPNGYPAHVVPVIQGGKILASSKRIDPENNVYYSVMICLDNSVAEVVSFYQAAFKNIVGLKRLGTDKYLFFTGSKQNKFFSVQIASGEVNQKKKVILTILIRPKTSTTN